MRTRNEIGICKTGTQLEKEEPFKITIKNVDSIASKYLYYVI